VLHVTVPKSPAAQPRRIPLARDARPEQQPQQPRQPQLDRAGEVSAAPSA
jgi:hypothetical protein